MWADARLRTPLPVVPSVYPTAGKSISSLPYCTGWSSTSCNPHGDRSAPAVASLYLYIAIPKVSRVSIGTTVEERPSPAMAVWASASCAAGIRAGEHET
jgi:hypothetical protein